MKINQATIQSTKQQAIESNPEKSEAQVYAEMKSLVHQFLNPIDVAGVEEFDLSKIGFAATIETLVEDLGVDFGIDYEKMTEIVNDIVLDKAEGKPLTEELLVQIANDLDITPETVEAAFGIEAPSEDVFEISRSPKAADSTKDLFSAVSMSESAGDSPSAATFSANDFKMNLGKVDFDETLN